jgi:hypothetical protein
MIVIPYKSDAQIEMDAMVALRGSTDKSKLNNKNVDCWCNGYRHCQYDVRKELQAKNNADKREVLQDIIDYCQNKIEEMHENDGYSSGYMYSIPEGEVAMYKLLADVAKSAGFIKENLENIKLHYSDYKPKETD